MRSLVVRLAVLGWLALAAIAGCFRAPEAGTQPPRNEAGPLSAQSGPVPHVVMRMPAQLEPQQPTPPPPSQVASTPPSLPAGPGTEESKQLGLNLANSLSEVFHDAASRVLPAVVTIRTVSSTGEGVSDETGIPESLRPLFGGDDSEEVHESLGSGVIIDPSGIVLTNYHVVREKGDTSVQLRDGREFQIEAATADPHTDLALVKLKGASDLPVARLGNSDSLKVGDWVIAVGNPFGLEATVTAGIISAKGRGLVASPREEFLQTDAPINPGNSGGPLVNLLGDVVGINTAISTTTGGYQGIGFAIPINLAKWVGRQLIEHGVVHWAYLGVGVRKLIPDLASRVGVEYQAGLLVLEVRHHSPASKAGVHTRDIITRFDDKPVTEPRQLQSAVGMSEIGSQHTLTIARDGKTITIKVAIAEQPPQRPRARPTSDLLSPDSTGEQGDDEGP